MGFPLEACRRAVYYTGNTGIDAATNWIMSHMDDPGENWKKTHTKHKEMCEKCGLLYSLFALLSGADFAAPLVLPGCSSGAGTTPTESVSEEHLETIVSMGFSRDQATKALRATVRFKGTCHGCSEVRSGQFITGENQAAQHISRKKIQNGGNSSEHEKSPRKCLIEPVCVSE